MSVDSVTVSVGGFMPGQQLIYTPSGRYPMRHGARREFVVEVIRERGRTRHVGWPCYEVRRLDTGQRLRVAAYSLRMV